MTRYSKLPFRLRSLLVISDEINLILQSTFSQFLLGRVALVRGVAGYSHQTFPSTICRSVRMSVQCIVEKPGMRMPFGIIGRTGSMMRQVLGFGNRSTGRGTFGGEFGTRHWNQWALTFAATRPSSQITLGRLVYKRCNSLGRKYSTHVLDAGLHRPRPRRSTPSFNINFYVLVTSLGNVMLCLLPLMART